MKTLRERIAELTVNAKTQTALDALVSAGLLKQLRSEYPTVSASGFFYEWDSRKNSIRREV